MRGGYIGGAKESKALASSALFAVATEGRPDFGGKAHRFANGLVNLEPFVYLKRFCKLLSVKNKVYYMARYLLELSLVEYAMLKYSSR